VAEAAGVVFTSVPGDGVLEDVASGPNGVLAGLAAGKTWVDVSTVSPQASRELAARVRTRVLVLGHVRRHSRTLAQASLRCL
jgi:3-hydroxyisobutyrate dehydrogenase-like beta-hydroxyacid dehydrogenase